MVSSLKPNLKRKALFFSSVDNSEWMRNGDFIPTRLQAQQDAVNAVCHMKMRQNQENSVGLLSLAEYVSVCGYGYRVCVRVL